MTKLIPHFRPKKTEMSIRPGLISGSTLVSEFEGKMRKNETVRKKITQILPARIKAGELRAENG